MALREDDLAILSARFGVARFGASRFGFYPDDVEGSDNDEPGEYVWKEDKPPTTLWTLQSLYSYCGEAPDASFTYEACLAVDETVLFTDTSTPEERVSFWYWTFGDGEDSYDQNPTHSYSSAGAYTVTLYVSGSSGGASTTAVISVGLDVTAAASNETPVAFEEVTFTPTVVPGRSPFAYLWNFEGSTLADGLVSWWELDEESGTRADAVGGNDLTDTGTVGYATGHIGNAASFVQANNEELSYSAANAPASGTSFTYAMWLNTSAYYNQAYLLYNLAANSGFYAQVANSTSINWGVRSNLGNLTALSNEFSFNVWHLVVMWYDQSDGKAYIQIDDGTVFASSAGGYTKYPTGTISFSEASAQSCDTLMDCVGHWSRALTTAERTELYNSGSGIVSPASSDEIATYTYIAEGSYTPEVTVTDANDCVASDTVNITVQSPG